MRSSELKVKLQEAITLAQAGQRVEARRLLDEIVRADPAQELAWMWLATVSTNREERIQFLARALALNPDNPTTRQAYTQLTGQVFVPPQPETSATSTRPAWLKALLKTLTREASLSATSIVILMSLAVMAALVVIVVVNMRNNNKDTKKPRPLPTLSFILATPTPTSRYSPTPSRTPFPTPTFGPSPTRIWDVSVPTWTPVPSRTQPPTLTLLPSWTPIPTQTNTPTLLPPTQTFTSLPPTNTRAATGPTTAAPSAVPVTQATPVTPTPGAATLTAESALTSDHPAPSATTSNP